MHSISSYSCHMKALQASGINSGKKGRGSAEGGLALPKPIRSHLHTSKPDARQ